MPARCPQWFRHGGIGRRGGFRNHSEISGASSSLVARTEGLLRNKPTPKRRRVSVLTN